MSYQQPRINYAKIEPTDYFGAAERGVRTGMNAVAGGMAMKQATQRTAREDDEQGRTKALRDEISAIYADGNEAGAAAAKKPNLLQRMMGTSGTPEGEAEPAQPDEGLLARKMGTPAAGGQPPASAVGEQGGEAGQPKNFDRIKANAGKMDRVIAAYRKHGFNDEAAGMEQKYFQQVVGLASLDPKMAEGVWNSSFLKNNYGELTLKRGRKIKTEIKGNTLVSFDEDGELVRATDLSIFDGGYLDENKIFHQIVLKPPTSRKVERGDNTETEEFNQATGKWDVIGKAPRWKKDDGGTGSGNGEGKTAEIRDLQDAFIQRYTKDMAGAGDGKTNNMLDMEGKAPDFNTLLSRVGTNEVPDKVGRNGKPMTVAGLYREGATHYEELRAKGTPRQRALRMTEEHLQGYGATDLAKAKEHLSDEELNAIRDGRGRAEIDDRTGQYVYVPKPAGTQQGQAATGRPPAKPKVSRYQQDKERALKHDAERAGRPQTTLQHMGTPKKSKAAEVDEDIRQRQTETSPEAEQKEIDARVRWLTARGVPENMARKRAEDTIRPKYAELRRALSEYLGEAKQ